MTLPVELLQRRASPERYDAAVVGGGIAGLVCAAVLARGGARTVLIERGKRAGGRMQTVAHQGYAVDAGPLVWDAIGFPEVLAATGAAEVGTAALHPRDALRVVVAREGGSAADPLCIPAPGGVTSPAVLEAVRTLYGVPPRIFAALGEAYQELLQASAEQLEAWRSTTLAAWLAEHPVEPVVAAALQRSALLLGAFAPERASLALVAQHARWLASPKAPGLVTAGDGPIAGTRGVVQALVDACLDAGVELRLGTRAIGVALDRGRFTRLEVRREEHLFSDEVVAAHCVLACSRDELGAILPRDVHRALDTSFPREPQWSALGVAWALRGVPELRGTGAATEVPLVRLVSPPEAAHGAFSAPVTLFWPSAYAPRVAPPGHALLVAGLPLPEGATTDAREVDRALVLLRTFVREVYPELPGLLDWEHRWVHAAGPPDPFVAPVLPGVVPGCRGLALAGAEVATPGTIASGVAAAALSGKAAAERILAGG